MLQGDAYIGLARRVVASMLCALLLAACPDGYPTEDAPQTDPARMTQAQLLAALNELGAQQHLGKRWQYRLRPECELEVSVRGDEAGRRHVALEGAEVSSRSADGLSDILITPAEASLDETVTVLQTQRWPDSVQAQSLLSYLEVRCGQAGTSGS